LDAFHASHYQRLLAAAQAGRSLVDLLNTIETLKACGVDLYLDQQAITRPHQAGS
jgi:hypothetical protein